MEVIIAHPENTSRAYAPEVVRKEDEASLFLKDAIPAIFQNDAAQQCRYHFRGPGLMLRISRKKTLARSTTLGFRASFRHAKSSYNWSAIFSLKISTMPGSPHQEIIYTSIGGNPAALQPDYRRSQFTMLEHAITAFHAQLKSLPEFLPPEAIPAKQLSVLCADIHSRIAELASEKDQEARQKADALSARHSALNALPEGTPFKIRANSYARRWQIAIKRGAITKSEAPNICLLRPADLNSEDVRNSSVSAHQLLPLIAAAQTAETQADDFLFEFHTKGKSFVPGGFRLDQDMPLHQSSRETPELKKRRSTAQKIWVQSRFHSPPSGYLARIGDKNRGFMLGKSRSQIGHPSFPFPSGNSTNLRWIQHSPYSKRAKPLSSFCLPAGLFVVSREIAALIASHNIGRSTLEPVVIFAEGGSQMPGGWHHLVIREEVRAVLPHRCNPDLMKSMSERMAKPYEISVDPGVAGDLDLWTDPQLTPQPVFLSDRLYKALKAANALPPIGLRRCDTT